MTAGTRERVTARYDFVTAEADYRAAENPPRRSILVCTSMRSGSTLLGEAMYFAGGLGCPLEYYHSGFRPGFEQRWDARDIVAYTAALHRWRTDASGTFSTKLFWQDMLPLVEEIDSRLITGLPGPDASQWRDEHYRQVWSTLAPLFPKPIFVRLLRKDELAQSISNFVAGATRRYRLFGWQPAPATPDYDFDAIVRALAAVQNHNRHWQRFLAANALMHRTILYEDLSENYDAAVSALLANLGAETHVAPKPRLNRQRGAHSEEIRARFLGEFRLRAQGGG